MGLYSTNAIVLRSRNFGEADRILVLLSEEHGKFEAVAKGARRPRSRFAAGAQPFNYLRAMLMSGKNIDTLSQLETIHSFSGLREELVKLAYASFWVELLDSFIPEKAEVGEVFKFLLAAFIVLEKSTDPKLLNLAFESRLLNYLGYQPELSCCTSCGTGPGAVAVSFSAESGGLICANCGPVGDRIGVSAGIIEKLQLLGRTDIREVGKLGIETGMIPLLEKILRGFIEFRLDRPLKSQVFLDNVLE